MSFIVYSLIGELNAKPTDTRLDLTGYEFYSLIGLHEKMPRLTELIVSKNKLREFEVDVFKNLPNLQVLDLSHNNFIK